MMHQRHSIRSVVSMSASSSSGAQRSVEVVLLNKEKFVVYVEGKQTRIQDVFHRACEHLGLRENEYFGLALLVDGDYQFQALESKLHKIAPKMWKMSKTGGDQQPVMTLYFRVQYYVDHISLLKERVTRNLYYLQLKDNLLNHSQSVSEDKCFLLAASALQADFGDHTTNRQTSNYFDPREYFPAWVLSKYGEDYILQHMPKLQAEVNVVTDHNKRRSLTKTEAQMQFIREVSLPPIAHNLNFYQLKKRKTDPLGSIWLAICPKGIQIYEVLKHNNLKSLLSTFLWAEIDKLHHDKKKFELVTKDKRKFLYYTGSDERSKYLLSLSESTHKFNLTMQPRLAEIRHMEETDKRTSERYVYCENVEFSWERSSVHSRSSLHSGRHSPRVDFTARANRPSLSSNSSNTTSGIVSDRQHASLDESEEDSGREIMITSPPMPQPPTWQSVTHSTNMHNVRSPTPVLPVKTGLMHSSMSRSSSGHSQKSGKLPLLSTSGFKNTMSSTPIARAASFSKASALPAGMVPTATAAASPKPVDTHLQRTVFPPRMMANSRTLSSPTPVTQVGSAVQGSRSYMTGNGLTANPSHVERDAHWLESQQLYLDGIRHSGAHMAAQQQQDADSMQYKMLAQKAKSSSGRAATMGQFLFAQKQLQHQKFNQPQQLQINQQQQLNQQQLNQQKLNQQQQQQQQLNQQQQQQQQQQTSQQHQQLMQQQQQQMQQHAQQQISQQQQQISQQLLNQQQQQQNQKQQLLKQLPADEAALYAGTNATFPQYTMSSVAHSSTQPLSMAPPIGQHLNSQRPCLGHSNPTVSLMQCASGQGSQQVTYSQQPAEGLSQYNEAMQMCGTYTDQQVITQTAANSDLPPLTVTQTITKAAPAQYQPQQVIQQRAKVIPVTVAQPQVANCMKKPSSGLPLSKTEQQPESSANSQSYRQVTNSQKDAITNGATLAQQQQHQQQQQQQQQLLQSASQQEQEEQKLAMLKKKAQEELLRNRQKELELLQYLKEHEQLLQEQQQQQLGAAQKQQQQQLNDESQIQSQYCEGHLDSEQLRAHQLQLEHEQLQLQQLLENCTPEQLAKIQELGFQLQLQEQIEQEQYQEQLRTQQHEQQLEQQLKQFNAHLQLQAVQDSLMNPQQQQQQQPLPMASCLSEETQKEQILELQQYKTHLQKQAQQISAQQQQLIAQQPVTTQQNTQVNMQQLPDSSIQLQQLQESHQLYQLQQQELEQQLQKLQLEQRESQLVEATRNYQAKPFISEGQHVYTLEQPQQAYTGEQQQGYISEQQATFSGCITQEWEQLLNEAQGQDMMHGRNMAVAAMQNGYQLATSDKQHSADLMTGLLQHQKTVLALNSMPPDGQWMSSGQYLESQLDQYGMANVNQHYLREEGRQRVRATVAPNSQQQADRYFYNPDIAAPVPSQELIAPPCNFQGDHQHPDDHCRQVDVQEKEATSPPPYRISESYSGVPANMTSVPTPVTSVIQVTPTEQVTSANFKITTASSVPVAQSMSGETSTKESSKPALLNGVNEMPARKQGNNEQPPLDVEKQDQSVPASGSGDKKSDLVDQSEKSKEDDPKSKAVTDDGLPDSLKSKKSHSPWCPLHSINPSHIEEVRAKKADMPLLSGLLNAKDLRECRCHLEIDEPAKRKSYAHPEPEPMWNEPGTFVRPVSWHCGNFSPTEALSTFKELNIGEALSSNIFGSEVGEVRVNGLDMSFLKSNKGEDANSRLVPEKISSGGP